MVYLTFLKCEVFNSYDKKYERKIRVQLYQLVQINTCTISFHVLMH